MIAISHLYNSSPSIQAARTILLGQLLGSGVVVRREGRDVNLTPVFARHLEDVWLPFARSVVDSFLQFGFVVVSLENEAPPPFANFIKGKKMASGSSNMAPRSRAGTHPSHEAPTAAESRQRAGHGIEDDVQMDARVNYSKGRGNLVPTVPDLGQYEVSFVHTGESNYTREYRIFSTNSDSVYRQDFSSEMFFRSQPDPAGNICSPVATVFQSASFISSLEELALQAEVVRARQLLVTQPAIRQSGNQNLDPSNLFFDSESRAVQASSAADEDSQQAQSLATTAKLMQVINRMQTTDDMGRERPAASGGVTHLPPPMPPTLFTCPEKQQVVPGIRPPEARSDLVDLMRTVNDHISAAMGVPASVVFEGKFSSNSMSQLQLLNTTVASIALVVNKVLTACYQVVYDDSKEEDELVLLTAPLSSTAEIEALYTAGVIDIDSALPSALHSLGSSAVEIEGALKRRREADASKANPEAAMAETSAMLGEYDAKLKEAQTQKTLAEVDKVRADTDKTAAEVGVVDETAKKTAAETKKTEHDAKAPHPTAAAAAAAPVASAGAGAGAGAGAAAKKKPKEKQ